MKSVLIIEDEAISALMLKKVLSKYFITEVVENSEKCKQICSSRGFDFVLLDINLGPNSEDGLHVLKNLKANPLFENTHFCAVTANALPGDKEKYLRLGFDNYFPKPIIFDEIIERIQSVKKNNTIGRNS